MHQLTVWLNELGLHGIFRRVYSALMLTFVVFGGFFFLRTFVTLELLDSLTRLANTYSTAIFAALVTLVVLVVSRYLNIFRPTTIAAGVGKGNDQEATALLREVRNYLVHAVPRSQGTEVNIDDAFKGQLLARLATESQKALSEFIESEIFKKASEADQKARDRTRLSADATQSLRTYQEETASWRKNANVNLVIGLACAIVGIFVMWQTLITLNFEIDPGNSWRVTDLYRFVARFGLVLIIESVAFFFLKLYREDRSMIRYLRNEITNLESRYLALQSALSFGTPADLAKVLQSLSATERNFLVKKGDRVISDINYENSEIVLEKLLARFPDLIGKVKPTTSA